MSAELRRRCYLGVIADDVRLGDDGPENLTPGVGAVVRRVLPGSAAATAGIRQDDQIIAIDETPVGDVAAMLAAVRSCAPGTSLQLTVLRRGISLNLNVELTAVREKCSPGARTVYSSIRSDDLSLRTIATVPLQSRPCPTVLLFQGIHCESLDHLSNSPNPYNLILSEFARQGFATICLERRGTGDSEGPPTRDVDFWTENRDYVAFAQQARDWDFVNRNQLFFFGYSMGAVHAALLADKVASAGLVTFRTLGKPWYEYVTEISRTQRVLAGLAPETVAAEMCRVRAFWKLLTRMKLPPAAIVRRFPTFKDLAREYINTRHYVYFQQVAGLDVPRLWREIKAHVLVVAGSADYVAPQAHQVLVFRFLAERPGSISSSFLLAPVDHGFHRVHSIADSYLKRYEAPFCSATACKIASWMRTLCGDPKAPEQ